MVQGSNPAAATSLRNFGNSVYPLCQCLSEETLETVGPFYLSGGYARGRKRSHEAALEMCNLSLGDGSSGSGKWRRAIEPVVLWLPQLTPSLYVNAYGKRRSKNNLR